MKISLVVPCYNEEQCIEKYYEAMKPVREKIPEQFEFIFVDDGSKDKTLSIIKDLAKKDKQVRFISFSRNFGKEAAMYAGLKAATGDLVSLMDVDLQDKPELLIDMYKGITEEGYDCVACKRTKRKGRVAFLSKIFYGIVNKMSDVHMTEGERDFRLMTRKMTDAVLSLCEKERFIKGIFNWVGFNVKWLEYESVDRVAGGSKWSVKTLTKYALGGLEDFSTAPLKYNFVLSFLCMLATLIFVVLDIVWAATGYTVTELFIILPVVLFLFGLLFFGVGILGEYVKKTFTEVKSRPVYIVKETEKDNLNDN